MSFTFLLLSAHSPPALARRQEPEGPASGGPLATDSPGSLFHGRPPRRSGGRWPRSAPDAATPYRGTILIVSHGDGACRRTRRIAAVTTGVPVTGVYLPHTDHGIDVLATVWSPPARTAIHVLERFLAILA